MSSRASTSIDDRVAVADVRDRAAARRLRRDVPDHQAVRRAGEAAVRDQRDLVAEALADERCGDVQHLAHPGPAGRALVADHDDVARRIVRALTAAKHASSESNTRAGPRCCSTLVPGELDDAAVRREVAAQDREPAGRLERLSHETTTSWPGRSCAPSAT